MKHIVLTPLFRSTGLSDAIDMWVRLLMDIPATYAKQISMWELRFFLINYSNTWVRPGNEFYEKH